MLPCPRSSHGFGAQVKKLAPKKMTGNQLIGAIIMAVGLTMLIAPRVVRDIGGAWARMMGSGSGEDHPANALIVFRILGVPMIVAGALVFFNSTERG